MKKSLLILAAVLCLGTINVKAEEGNPKSAKKTAKKDHDKDDEHYMKAIRLFNTPNGDCTFEKGKIPTTLHLDVTTFWGHNHLDKYEKVAHAAPRLQYVVTLKGKLRFKVSDGKTFILEPGVILVAEDIKGKGHTWDMIKGDTWERLYIPLAPNAEDHFIKED